jgi:hypothetical protein
MQSNWGVLSWPLVELLQSTPSDVDGLRVPRYERFLNVPLPLPDDMTDERLLAANKRGGAPESSRSACFNCGQPTHAFSACPEPRNWSRIAANRNAARAHRGLSGEQAADERYYAGASRQEAMMTQFSAGVLSPELRAALRIGANEIPEFARRMRALGGLGPTYQTLVGTQDEIRIPGVNVDLPPEATQRYNPFDVDDGPPPPPPPPTTHARPANYWSGYS